MFLTVIDLNYLPSENFLRKSCWKMWFSSKIAKYKTARHFR